MFQKECFQVSCSNYYNWDFKMKEKLFRTTLIKAAKRKREKISFGHREKNTLFCFWMRQKYFTKETKNGPCLVCHEMMFPPSQGGHAPML